MFGIESCFDTPVQFAAAAAVLAVAEIVYVMLGFGSGLIAVGALAAVFPDIRDVVVMLLIVNLPAEIYIIFKEAKSIDLKSLSLIFAGIAIGIPAGSWLLRTGEPTFLLTILGGILAMFGIFFFAMSIRNDVPSPLRSPRWTEPGIGAAAGLLAGLFGTGGPPLIAFFQLTGTNKALFRAKLMACFFFFAVVRIPSYLAADLLTEERVISSMMVLPAVLIGAVIGNAIHIRISERRFKQVVSLAISGIGMILLTSRLR